MEQSIFFVSDVEIFGYYYKSNNSPVPSGDAIDNVVINLIRDLIKDKSISLWWPFCEFSY